MQFPRFHRAFLTALVPALLFTGLVSATAQQAVKLEFNGGLVSLSARNAPIRTILSEWARLGGATILNADKVVGAPVTLELAGVPERQALDIVLRNVAGYMLAPRPAGTQGASAFNRIVILPTSVAPRNPAPGAAAGGRPPIARPGIVPRQPEDDVDIPAEVVEEIEPVAAQDGMPVNQPRIGQPPFVMRQPVQQQEGPESGDGSEAGEEAQPVPAGVGPTQANPFGVPFGSSATPGVITPAPKPAGPNRVPPNRVQ
jgi:hypothetical protein